MPLVASSSNIPLWIVSQNNRTRMNKFNRCKSLETLHKRINKIQNEPGDRIDNKGQMQRLKISRQRHNHARNQQIKIDHRKIQRENLLMFLRLNDARYGPEKYYQNGEMDPRTKELYRFKHKIRKIQKRNFRHKCKVEDNILLDRINTMQPSYYLNRKYLSKSFHHQQEMRNVLMTAKSRLRIDSFKVKKQMDKEHEKMKLLYKDMAQQMKWQRIQNNTRRIKNKSKLPHSTTIIGHKKRSRVRPQSATVGMNANNILIPNNKSLQQRLMRPSSATPLTRENSNKNNYDNNKAIPSTVQILSATQSEIRSHVSNLLSSHIEQHDDTTLTHYLTQ